MSAAPTLLSSPMSMATESSQDFKALVFVLLDGGNDAAHMVVPTSDPHYQIYQGMRHELAIGFDQLIQVPTLALDHEGQEVSLGLHPKLSALADAFNHREATFVMNSGVLKQPVTKEEVETQAFKLPPFLYSHNSQKLEWAKGATGHPLTTGWAGRLMDVLNYEGGQVIPPLFSHSGDAPLLRSSTMKQNIIRGENIARLSAPQKTKDALQAYLNAYTGIDGFDNTLLSSDSDAMHVAQGLIDTIEAISDDETKYPETKMGTQFRITSRLIRQSKALGHGKQIFFLRLGGFDTHADQIETLDELYLELGDAMAAFHAHLKELGFHEQVITSTMSDFGRCLVPNSSGTDHGWGGHQIIMGAGIDGGQAVGTFPDYRVEGLDTVSSRGRLIPTTAADQVHICLARWFGASDVAINYAFPNHANFEPLNFVQVR